MNNNKERNISNERGGIFNGLSDHIKLVLRLLGDRRVNPFIKLLPVGSLIYLILPDIAPGPIDDAAVIWLGLFLFVELCPPDVVEEHRRKLSSAPTSEFHDPADNEEMIEDAEFWEKE